MLNVEHGHLDNELAEAAFLYRLLVVCAPVVVRHHALPSALVENLPAPGSRVLLGAPTPTRVFLITWRRPLSRDVGGATLRGIFPGQRCRGGMRVALPLEFAEPDGLLHEGTKVG